MSSEVSASLWKGFRGRGILSHTPCIRGVEIACSFEVEVMVRVAFFHKQGHNGS